MMSPTQIAVIQATADAVLGGNRRVVDVFYDRLFALEPSARKLFRDDMDALKLKFMNMLAALIGAVEHPAMFTSIVEDLGRRHARYGVRPQHFPPVRAALLFGVEQGLGPLFTPEVRDTWEALYDWVSRIMLAEQAAADHAGNGPAPQERTPPRSPRRPPRV